MQTASHPRVQWVFLAQQPDGSVVCQCQVCNAQARALQPEQIEAFARAHAQHQSSTTHYGAGDVVAGVTKAMGIAPCTPCEQRRQQMNGWLPSVFRRRR